ncbi:MAG: DUF4126 domain-containing protein [Desulfobacterales bacterium]|jgi:hypothetical protein|nr:DUF4126 domain-containing protein [Desulfobacteraceae bacterium]MDD3991175.1 DUF4126 domain-containing protein [Desulfobacteraceae bacterium]MDY0311623.1 DUF4126 domain-containing protein [Desulfobacterales bacterium]
MEPVSHITHIIALTMGAAWAAGINLYAAIATLGILGATGNMTLPPNLQVLADPLVIASACLMYAVEFFADKTPGVDTGWDTIHTFIRIPAGALLAAGAVGEINPAVTLAAALLGGTLAAGSHGLKAGSRLLINTSPEPFSNWTASIAEDILVIGGIWTAVHYPWLFLFLLVLFILLVIWMLPKIWRGIRLLAGKLKQLFTPRQPTPPVR